jgi:Lecithin:cholesterol acyltransferase
MDTIILVPGGGGSRLTLQNKEVWPPTLLEFGIGYHRTTELRSPNVKVGTILDGVPQPLPCYGVYQPLQDDLAKIAKSCGAQFVNFPYDWRKDVVSSAEKLAAKIKSRVSSSSDKITLVCHSMGNLLARIILESGDYASKSWFGNIKRYVGICGPHYGVPVILEYTLGLKSWLGISSSDMKTLSKDPRYPSCYQCLPFKGKTSYSTCRAARHSQKTSTIHRSQATTISIRQILAWPKPCKTS